MLYNVILMVMSRGSRIFFSIVVTLLFSRFLPTNEYGVFRQFMLIVNFSSSLFIFGIPNAMGFYYPGYNKSEKKRLVTTIIFSLLILGVLNFIFVYISIPIFNNLLNINDLTNLRMQVAIYSSLLILVSVLEYLYVVTNKHKAFLINNVSVVLIFSLLVAIALASGVISVKLIIYIYSIIEIFKILYTLFVCRECIGFSYKWFSLIQFKKIIRYSLPLWGSSLLALAQQQFSSFLATAHLSTEEYAIYSNGVMDIPLLSLISISTSVAIIPLLKEKLDQNEDNYQSIEIWNKVTEKLIIIYLLSLILFFIYSREYIIILFSKKYINSLVYFKYNVVKLPSYAFLINSLYMAFNMNKSILKINLVFFAITVIGSISISNVFNMSAVVLFTVIMSYIQLSAQLMYFKNKAKAKSLLNISYERILKVSTLYSICCVLLSRLFKFYPLNELIPFIISGIILSIYVISQYQKTKIY